MKVNDFGNQHLDKLSTVLKDSLQYIFVKHTEIEIEILFGMYWIMLECYFADIVSYNRNSFVKYTHRVTAYT